MPDTTTPRQIARGAAWMMLFKLADKGIGLVSTLVLARLLAPADFGLVAMAMAVVAFTQLMSAFGFDSALIQRKDAQAAHFNTAWTLNIIAGAMIATTLVLVAWPAASMYKDDRLVGILLVLAGSALIGSFENIGVVTFRKDLNFRREFTFLFAKRIVSFAVTMACAFTLQNYWALVIGTSCSRILSVVISYLMHPYRPRLTLAARQDLMHFSRWIFLSSLVGFIGGRSIDFILGRTVGPHGLGVYTIAYEVATMPSTEVIAPVNRAVYPAYAKLATDPPQLQERFLQVFGLICLLAIPVSAGLFMTADAFVRVVLGEKWLETVPIIRVFAFCGLVAALQSNMYLVIVALGKPQANTLLTAILAVLTMPAVVWTSMHYGVVGASYAMLAQACIALVGIWISFLFHTRFSGRRTAKLLVRPILASAVMALCMSIVNGALGPDHSQVARLLVLVLTGATAYIAAVFALWGAVGRPDSSEAHVLGFLIERWRAALGRTR